MAVAAYASLVSLTHVLDNLHYRARFNIPRADINQVEALQKNVNSLLEFVELHSERKIPELRGLWRKMAEAAAEAESDINFHVANLLYAKSQGETSDTSSFSAFCDEMETLIQKFCSIEKEFPVIEEDGGEDAPAQKQSNYASVAAGGSPAATSYVSNVVVGLDEHVNTIRDKLVRGRSKLEILPIVGMGGIEIWEMPQLREIRCSYDAHFPDPIATDIEGEDFIILKDLHTLNGIGNFNCTKEVIDRIPNLKKLRISYGNGSETGVIQLYDYSLCNLEQLQKLESLSISGCLEEMTFPNSLKELRLINCMGIAWEDMSIVGLLPSLETLEISDGGVHGSEWEPVQGEFRRLKELDINNTDLVCWRAESVHFPILEKLKLIGLRSLEEIPWGIGDILTLKSIDVIRCSESVVDSAKEIWVEQHELGNEIRIDITDEEQGIEYQIGTFTARMTGAACESLAYLKHLPEKLSKVAQHGRDSLNGKQMEAVEEAIHFFKDFFKVFHPRKSQEMESLLREMAQATHKAEIVVRRLRSETLMPILGKCVREDVERLLEKIDFIRKALSVAEEEGQENEQINGDNDATSYDINSLKIMRADLLRYRDEDLREYQIGSVTAALTEDASLIWSDLACALEVLRKASELGRHHLNTKLMENVDKSISFLQDVVKVHPQIILQYTKAIGYGYMYYYLVMAVEDLNSKHLGRQSLEDATDEEILSFSEHVENVLNKLINHRIWFTKASKLKTHSQEESTDEEI
ncbi:uncharacterized protein LOC127246016 isoform X2 [Andrographis paniculata]|uniref:uncharacterized protein LOC127246016 isoform X2 n=1 Tax=Andrographis paniculata TaxID=175694 RepID=UPI0021E8D340|nr:uncharacterized protein LOC127246016 isoform X2 [Andrographis paniculata]